MLGRRAHDASADRREWTIAGHLARTGRHCAPGKTQQRIGAFVRFSGSEGQGWFEALHAARADIDAELARAGLPSPKWDSSANAPMLSVEVPAPLPWDAAAEDAQAEFLAGCVNQLVNSLRPRLERLALVDARA